VPKYRRKKLYVVLTIRAPRILTLQMENINDIRQVCTSSPKSLGAASKLLAALGEFHAEDPQ
jgi:hypothetical protein